MVLHVAVVGLAVAVLVLVLVPISATVSPVCDG